MSRTGDPGSATLRDTHNPDWMLPQLHVDHDGSANPPPKSPAGSATATRPGLPVAAASTPSGGTTTSDDSATVCHAGTVDLPPAPWLGNPFSPTSFWNAPLAADAPLDTNSQAHVNELVRQVQAYGPWMNTYSYSTPVYLVPPNQPVQHVTLDWYGPDLQAAFNAVPIPCDAKAAAASDEHMVAWQPSTDKMWEFWQMHQGSDGWHATWGDEMDKVSTNPGYFDHASGQDTNWGATATGLPLLGGLVTEADLQRGYINHALAISLVETAPAYSGRGPRNEQTVATSRPASLRSPKAPVSASIPRWTSQA